MDILTLVKGVGLVGIQRKAFRDFVASARDGRLGKECSQMKALDLGIVILEGTARWNTDGTSSIIPSWSQAQHIGVMLSIQSQGYWLLSTVSPQETCTYVLLLTKWLGKDRHSMLKSRPKPKGEWGTLESEDWQVHLMQSFEGIGRVQAERIVAHFGKAPLAWTVGVSELMMVEGIGAGRAIKMLEALDKIEDPIVEQETE